jgi:peptidoglycan/LPS O-acetylase OafA/YrhL
MAARVIRLWPIMVLGVTVGLLQSLVGPVAGKDLPLGVGGRLACAGFNLFILPCPPGLSSQMFPPDPPEWSLFYELIANLLFALAFGSLLKARALIAVIGAGGVVLALGILHYQGLRFGLSVDAVPYYLGRVAFSFFLGVFLQRTKGSWAARLPVLPPGMIYLLLLGLLAVPQTSPPAQLVLHLATVFVLGPLLVMLGAVAQPRGFTIKVSNCLGDLSYPLYAIHMPLIFLFSGLAPAPWDRSVPVDLCLIAVAIGSATVLPRIYDAPVRRLLTPLSQRGLGHGRPLARARIRP